MKSIIHCLPFLLHTHLRNGKYYPSNQIISSSRINTGSTKSGRDSSLQPPIELVRYQVCQSPGCLADGAKETLERLQALAPPNVIVETGSCFSACGHGPVISEERIVPRNFLKIDPGEVVESRSQQQQSQHSKKSLTHRRVKGSARVLQLLLASKSNQPQEQPEQEQQHHYQQRYGHQQHHHAKKPPQKILTETPLAVVQGYDLSLQGDTAFTRGDYETAIRIYEEVVRVAFSATIELQRARERIRPEWIPDRKPMTRVPDGLVWLIRARRNQARAYLELGHLQDAMLAAQAACNISRNACSETFQVIAEIYQRKGEDRGELQALQTMFALPIDESKMSVSMKNRRRELTFRMVSLARQLSEQANASIPRH